MTPLIIPNYNQLTYLRNLVNWWKWYTDEEIYIIDNGSDYVPLLEYYWKNEDFHLVKYDENDCQANLADFLSKNKFPYYVISDPDIMPHPSTPPNFLEVFRKAIDSGYHRAGFDLITDDLPDWLHNKATVIENEKLAGQEYLEFEGFPARRAAIDTTFCMYSGNNSGWHQPFDGTDWPNALRIFKAYHLAWYEHPDYLNEERKHYYTSCKKHDYLSPPAGRNNYRPLGYD